MICRLTHVCTFPVDGGGPHYFRQPVRGSQSKRGLAAIPFTGWSEGASSDDRQRHASTNQELRRSHA